MSYVRTAEHRARARETILAVKPWKLTRGPKTPEGKARSAANRKLSLDRARLELREAETRYAKLHGGKLPEQPWERELREILGSLRIATRR